MNTYTRTFMASLLGALLLLLLTGSGRAATLVAALPQPERLTEPVELSDPQANNGPFSNFATVGPWLYYVAPSTTTGHEIWKTNGRPAGTSLVKDLTPGPEDSNIQHLTEHAGRLFFITYSDGNIVTLWQSDGTAEGTTVVKQFGEEVTGISGLTSATGSLFFLVDCCDASRRSRLWKSDGTAEGTVEVADVESWNLFAAGELLFFAGYTQADGIQLWRSDGTAAGTRMVAVIDPITKVASPEFLGFVGDQIYFTANDGTHGRELWVTDGSEPGTRIVKDIYLGEGSGLDPFSLTFCSRFTSQAVFFRGRLFFAANDGLNGYELWASDGTGEGTVMVADILVAEDISESDHSFPYQLAVVNDQLLFTARGPAGYELWRSDGTAAGTKQLVDLNSGENWSTAYLQPSESSILCPVFGYFLGAYVANGLYFFGADDGVHGRELWVTDGTAANTTLVANIAPGQAHGWIRMLGLVPGALIFVAHDSANSATLTGSLWALDFRTNQVFLPKIQR